MKEINRLSSRVDTRENNISRAVSLFDEVRRMNPKKVGKKGMLVRCSKLWERVVQIT